MKDANEMKDFNDLVSWATWHVLEGLTQGQPLRSLIFSVIEYARRWKPPTD